MTEPSTDTPAAAARYWTAPRLLIAIGLCVVVFGAAGYLVRDDAAALITGRNPDAARGRGLPVGGPNAEPPFDTSNLTLDRDRIRRGGPAKDGIPSLTDPKIVPVADAAFMQDEFRVVGVTVNGESRAYPINALNWHECINDTLGGTPIAVIYCPLCDSVSVVDRRLGDRTYEFGISGLLYNSNVLLYDRQDDALWSQVGLEAISGPNAGRSLKHLDGWQITRFADWKQAHPDSTITTFETGHRRDYARNPYTGYFMNDSLMFPVEPSDDRMPNKTPIIGVRVGETARAYPLPTIAGELNDTLAGQPIVLRADSDTGTVDVIEAPDDASVVHTFWFAWCAFHPDTQVYEPSP